MTGAFKAPTGCWLRTSNAAKFEARGYVSTPPQVTAGRKNNEKDHEPSPNQAGE